MDGKTGIIIDAYAAARTACHAYRAIRMLGTVFMVMKSDYDYREKENDGKKKCYSLAVQY
ncbi:MAG TPA: hypothetical protein VMT12_14150 [Syntrophales bacterium]|nr:hypothetical protein [Syntrophales bacterium]